MSQDHPIYLLLHGHLLETPSYGATMTLFCWPWSVIKWRTASAWLPLKVALNNAIRRSPVSVWTINAWVLVQRNWKLDWKNPTETWFRNSSYLAPSSYISRKQGTHTLNQCRERSSREDKRNSSSEGFWRLQKCIWSYAYKLTNCVLRKFHGVFLQCIRQWRTGRQGNGRNANRLGMQSRAIQQTVATEWTQRALQLWLAKRWLLTFLLTRLPEEGASTLHLLHLFHVALHVLRRANYTMESRQSRARTASLRRSHWHLSSKVLFWKLDWSGCLSDKSSGPETSLDGHGLWGPRLKYGSGKTSPQN